MRIVRDEDIVPESTSHDSDLMKRVMIGPGAIRGLGQFSRIIFASGARASEHRHEDAWEVFFCARGRIIFSVDGASVTLRTGDCLAVEPGETHGVTETPEETELVYFIVKA